MARSSLTFSGSPLIRSGRMGEPSVGMKETDTRDGMRGFERLWSEPEAARIRPQLELCSVSDEVLGEVFGYLLRIFTVESCLDEC